MALDDTEGPVATTAGLTEIDSRHRPRVVERTISPLSLKIFPELSAIWRSGHSRGSVGRWAP